ncbi:MAG: serine/threonine protein kinase [Planctomycetes bacterium]|nr:serine/threonine protein kinase [Planctomycetota bacterium]MCC7398730.1 serine/threonine protein kinase [Planctomycetota bacterium]
MIRRSAATATSWSHVIADSKLLALLVHRGLLTVDDARAAMAAGDAARFLVQSGRCTAEQWQQWQRTEAGTRPVLSRYDVAGQLGEGAVGRVFAAIDKVDGREVALKVLRPELARDALQTERFVKEARLLMQLEHPQLVKGLRVAKEGETIFFAMERLPGECLQDILAREQRLDEESALQIVVEVAGALDALHQQQLVHRDVKPGNVLWSEERGAVLIDLGFAVAGGANTGGDTTAGTVHYIAPEQARGSDQLDVRADIYALGATLYHLTTGSLPFEGRTSEEVLRKQVLESLSGDRIRALRLSPHLHYFLEKMMAKDPAMRFQDPQQLQREIEAFLQQRRQQRELEAKQRDRPRLGDRPGAGDRRRPSMFERRRRGRR